MLQHWFPCREFQIATEVRGDHLQVPSMVGWTADLGGASTTRALFDALAQTSRLQGMRELKCNARIAAT